MSPIPAPRQHQGEAVLELIDRQTRDGAGGPRRPKAGLAPLVDMVIGFLSYETTGSRNTYRDLLRVADFSVLDRPERARMWLLLTTLGEDPARWGISDLDLPPIWAPPTRLRKLLLERRAEVDASDLSHRDYLATVKQLRRRGPDRDPEIVPERRHGNRGPRVRTARIPAGDKAGSSPATGPATEWYPAGKAA